MMIVGSRMRRILVTGGSGFIGTNLVDSLIRQEDEILSVDIREPQNSNHNEVFAMLDILDRPALASVFKNFEPTDVVHLAARTDLHDERDLQAYSVNTQGVENIVHCISRQSSVQRTIFTSTKLVCMTDYFPRSQEDYCPITLYGRSKVIGEKLVKNSASLRCDWCIVRPTSIWGPWSNFPHIPYSRFFRMIASGLYLQPGGINSAKTFGYVENLIFQAEKLLLAPSSQIHRKVFYLSDYEMFSIKDWADMISLKLRNKPVRTIPRPVAQLLAWGGDLLKICGMKEPPFSSFRLRNMQADTANVPLEPIKQITGPLPYSLEQGVDRTIAWLREHNLI